MKTVRPPLIGLGLHGSSTYGRAIARGVAKFANLQRRWVLHTGWEMRPETLAHWPSCDGIICGGLEPSVIDHLRSRSREIILCSGSSDHLDVVTVSLDDIMVGEMAAQHLLDCQLQNFAFYGIGPQRAASSKRFLGFKRKLAERGYEVATAPVPEPSPLGLVTHSHHPELIAWLNALPKPVGIMCSSDNTSYDLSVACMVSKLSVPDKVAIIGVNDDELLCEMSWPPLSSVIGDFSRVGYLAAVMLERLLSGETIPPAELHLTLPPLGVARRQSTDLVAVEDPVLVDALHFIRMHACDPCNVEGVTQQLAVGRRWLERQFVRQLGRTPYEEILRVRVETARRLLQRVDLSIETVARRCGFTTRQIFERAFKKASGETPANFRRNMTEGRLPRRA